MDAGNVKNYCCALVFFTKCLNGWDTQRRKRIFLNGAKRRQDFIFDKIVDRLEPVYIELEI